MPEVTIAIPFYNAETYLELAIVSVLSQTFTDLTLLLIDDGSTDSSLKIAQKYLDDKRVKVISDGKNMNLGNRLNQIPGLAETEYLARMDADDIMHPQRIEKQLKVLKDNPNIDVLGTNAYSIDENNDVLGQRMDFSNDALVSVTTFIHPSIMAKTDWFTNNLYDVSALRIEDSELWLRTSDKYVFMAISEPLLFYREIGDQYYKKYFKGFPGVLYMLRENKFSIKHWMFSLKYFLASFIYMFFNILGVEHILLQRRNKLHLKKKGYSFYI
ncbi:MULTISPECIES: glycosyltransferase family 2 protein [unclassified Chryseobacterium]|uniref:glycosyltransferase family 2 protein n=1 Tax=unclassified Chryseobacterium TaxID=2593645 RepID=UPI001C5AFF2B|nr:MULTISPECIES: glycosyltransferase family 2 protein [unclassified Chryseobacterium]MBW3523437.1 glycosyltransferase family 2 protein [Chryseobacterium sp. NKUCC03_KSP]MCD0457536.1 glycosyltransferase family 2 protein [Chryseobacterium sp. LC2016-27]